MKTNSTQEILLVTGISFTSPEFDGPTDELNYNRLTEKQKLEVACRNGLLPDMLPDIFEQHSVRNMLYTWDFRAGTLFIEFKLGEMCLEAEKQFSIDPHSFLPMQILS